MDTCGAMTSGNESHTTEWLIWGDTECLTVQLRNACTISTPLLLLFTGVSNTRNKLMYIFKIFNWNLTFFKKTQVQNLYILKSNWINF